MKLAEYRYPIERTLSGVRTNILGDKKSYHVDDTSLEPQVRSIENSWGRVTADHTEIRTEMVVYNPQPVLIYIERMRYI